MAKMGMTSSPSFLTQWTRSTYSHINMLSSHCFSHCLYHRLVIVQYPHDVAMETSQCTKQHPQAKSTGLEKLMVRLPSSAVTTTTLSTAGSDSRSSSAVSDQDAECCARVEEHTDKRNVSTDEYFSEEYVHKVNETARRENQKQNLNLGLPFDPSLLTRRQPIKMLIRLLHRFLLLVENPLFRIWSQFIPLRLRQKLTLLAWKVYFPLHKLFIGRKTGLHPDVSLEYHALTSVMWWGRLVRLFLAVILRYPFFIRLELFLTNSFLSCSSL